MATPHELADDKLGMLWAAKVWVVLLIAVFGAGTYFISAALPASYSSSSTVSVSARGSSTISPLDTVNASNGLASQDAQLVTTSTIENAAATRLGVSRLTGSISASTVANQNLVTIQVQSASRSTARAETAALSASLVSYLSGSSSTSASAYEKSISTRLGALDTSIVAAKKQVAADAVAARSARAGSAAATTLTNDQQTLAQLTLRKQVILSQAGVDAASQEPNAAVVNKASAPSKVFPKPILYAVIAVVVAAVLGTEMSWVVGRRRLRQAGARRMP